MNKLLQKRPSKLLISSVVVLFFCVPGILYAQSFNRGLTYYKAQNYKKAAAVFNALSAPRANLFLGKSYYALGQYGKALAALDRISPDSSSQLYMEAEYTAALANYQQKEFGKSLDRLYDVSRSNIQRSPTSNAKELYQQILGYLTAGQRKKIIKGPFNNAVKFDLLKSAIGRISSQKAADLYQTFTGNVGGDQWPKQLNDIRSKIQGSSNSRARLQPPKGTIYHIGVALPGYKTDSKNYAVVRGLYLGAVLAADQYNQNHQRTKAIIHFVDTGGSGGTMKTAVKHFVSQNYGDVLIGPLFSRQIQPMMSLTSKLKISAIAPMANGSNDLKNSWLYQANPTYKVQGKQMAKFAVNDLGFNRFTILSDENSRGAAAARAFKKEAQKLGATISHYFVRNLGSEYEFSKYTRYFGASPTPIKAVYAPLNGSNALTLIDLLLRKIRTVPHHITVLGAQEWGNRHFDPSKNSNIDIYYSKSDQSIISSRLRRFKSDYRQKFKSSGNSFSIIGYDIATFILKTLQQAGNPKLLKTRISHQSKYNGLARDIYFDGTHVNHAVHIVHASGS